MILERGYCFTELSNRTVKWRGQESSVTRVYFGDVRGVEPIGILNRRFNSVNVLNFTRVNL